MPLFCDNLIVSGKKEESQKSPPENTWNNIHHKLEQSAKQAEKEKKKAEKEANQITRVVPYSEKAKEKTHYEVVKEGDLVKHHNLKSSYLNDMTGFKN